MPPQFKSWESSPLSCMTKREFMIQYVLNRASTSTGALEGDAAAKEAEKAWNEINGRAA